MPSPDPKTKLCAIKFSDLPFLGIGNIIPSSRERDFTTDHVTILIKVSIILSLKKYPNFLPQFTNLATVSFPSTSHSVLSATYYTVAMLSFLTH